jgi:cellulose biosynthesis protein BcsQ
MSEKMVDIIMHIDEETSREQREELRDHLLQHNGVMAASYQEKQPHMMVIEYDPDVAKSSDFLDIAQSSGLHAELVGM